MPFNILATLQSVESKLKANGYFHHTQIGEPKAPPTSALTGVIYMSDVGVHSLTLNGTRERHTVTLRVYVPMLQEPQANIETDLAKVVSQVMSDLCGEFDLGATITAIDVGGMFGKPLSAKWGYIDVSGVVFRIADVEIGLIVDDSSTLVP